MNDPSASELKAIDAYPEAKAGQLRAVIWVPETDRVHEANLMVQVRFGLLHPVDGVNRYNVTAALNHAVVDGWGYGFYLLDEAAVIGQTRMASKHQNSKPETVWSTPEILRYNSRLPLVFYTPSAVEMGYRILGIASHCSKYNS